MTGTRRARASVSIWPEACRCGRGGRSRRRSTRRRTARRAARRRRGLLHPEPTEWLLSLASINGDRDVRLVEEQVVGPLALAPSDQLASHDDLPVGEAVLSPPLLLVPSSGLECRCDVTLADVGLAEFLLAHVRFPHPSQAIPSLGPMSSDWRSSAVPGRPSTTGTQPLSGAGEVHARVLPRHHCCRDSGIPIVWRSPAPCCQL